MISVPDAALLPSTPRPVRCMNGSITSCGNPCGYVGNACRRDDAHHLPVARRRVLALRALEQTPRDRRRPGLRRAALELLDVPEAERLHVGEIEPADGLGDVRERVGALVAVPVGVRQLTGADGVEHDHTGRGPRSWPPGYSRFGMDDRPRATGFRRLHRRRDRVRGRRDVARRAVSRRRRSRSRRAEPSAWPKAAASGSTS